MKKILILTAGFGDGHNAAARSLRDAIELLDENSRAEVLDLFADSYGAFNTLARKTYLGMVQYAPSLWGGIYSMLENPFVERQLGGFSRLQTMLEKILNETQPDCVVSTYPIYGHVIKKIFQSNERPFKFITIVTDSITINSAWFRAPSDYFCVANDASADVLIKGGVAEKQIKSLGFPVNPIFADNPDMLPQPTGTEPRRVLYIINTGKKKAGKAVDRLLDLENVHLTITAGRDPELRAKLTERTRDFGDRVKVLGWTNQMPELMMSHHLVISKAGGATVQEAIAARCPMIVNQVIPGQEEGNAELITRFNLGTVVEKNKEVAEAVELAFEKRATLWHEWRRNLKKISRPDAALRIGELILEAADHDQPGRKAVKLFEAAPDRVMRSPALAGGSVESRSQMLLCDFHIHTNYSDGKLSVPEVIDFYGERGFDCICITDHLADPKRLLGKLTELANCTLGQEQIGEYFAVIERERQRAWRRYKMLVLTGIEFNKDGYTRKTSAHLLGIDLKAPISAALDIPDIIEQIHRQGALAVASHPHIMKSEWGKNTLYLWENQEQFAPLLDAWEIANRNNIFNDIGLKRLPFIANSDFHKPKHIYSWKTLIHAAKDAEAIKDCIRRNEHVAITLYRDFSNQPSALSLQTSASGHLPYFQDRLPLHAINS
jgi:processive 1,2-diacylglycerol beta-glucosyltransferase